MHHSQQQRAGSPANPGRLATNIHTRLCRAERARPMRKGPTMLDALAECVAKNDKKYKDFKPRLEKIPDAGKEKI